MIFAFLILNLILEEFGNINAAVSALDVLLLLLLYDKARLPYNPSMLRKTKALLDQAFSQVCILN